MVLSLWLRSQTSLGEHAGQHADLAQGRGTDSAALRPRGSHRHERVLDLGEAGCLVNLCELSIDVETLLNQFDWSERHRWTPKTLRRYHGFICPTVPPDPP